VRERLFLSADRRIEFNHLLGVVRRFFEWMVIQEMIPECPIRARTRRETGRRVPVIFDVPLMRSLLELTMELPDQSRAPLRGPTYRLAFGLMYGLGLRVGEVHRLRMGDIDLQRRVLLVRESKFRKSRILPFGPRLGRALHDFLLLRRARWGEVSVDAPLLTFDGRQPVSANRISSTFQLLMPRLGFGERRGLGTPRAHDLRHSFAVGTLLRWYREGIEPGNRLLYLSTFLGHVGIHSTAVYLTVTTELLQEASRRFEPYAAVALGRNGR
jgi:site-specific recombinase XerD